jgi:hypothetical protein
LRDFDLGVLVDWFSKASANVSGVSLFDTGQILLCAKDLELQSYHLNKRLEQVVDLDDPPEHQARRLVLSFLRQIVLYRYGRNEAERRSFLEYWLHKRNRGRLDIVSRAYVVGLALEQQSLVPVDHRDYVTTWFSRKRLRANRVRGWVPHYLRLAGRSKEAQERAGDFLAERDSNGSWRGGYDATLALLYALLVSGLVPVTSLSSTVDYAARRYDGKCTGDHGTDALALKALFRSGLVTRHHIATIEHALRRASGVFLSHSSHDKPFVRTLARDLQAWGVWLDEEEVTVGDSIVGRVQGALSECRHVVVVLSRESVKSRWVQKEVNTALMSSLAGSGVRLLPVLKEDCDIPQLLREVRYADFRNSYKNGLRELLGGLDSCR